MPSTSAQKHQQPHERRFVLVAIEIPPSEDAQDIAKEIQSNVLPKMGGVCHIMASTWILETGLPASQIFGTIAGSKLINSQVRVLVLPIAEPDEDDKEPWLTQRPIMAKCFKM